MVGQTDLGPSPCGLCLLLLAASSEGASAPPPGGGCDPPPPISQRGPEGTGRQAAGRRPETEGQAGTCPLGGAGCPRKALPSSPAPSHNEATWYPGASTVPGISPNRNPTRPPPRTPHGQHSPPPPRPQRLLRQIYRDVHTLNRKLCLIYKCNFN